MVRVVFDEVEASFVGALWAGGSEVIGAGTELLRRQLAVALERGQGRRTGREHVDGLVAVVERAHEPGIRLTAMPSRWPSPLTFPASHNPLVIDGDVLSSISDKFCPIYRSS